MGLGDPSTGARHQRLPDSFGFWRQGQEIGCEDRRRTAGRPKHRGQVGDREAAWSGSDLGIPAPHARQEQQLDAGSLDER